MPSINRKINDFINVDIFFDLKSPVQDANLKMPFFLHLYNWCNN